MSTEKKEDDIVLDEDDDYSDEDDEKKKVKSDDNLLYKYSVNIDYKKEQYAKFIMNSLIVDKEINLNIFRDFKINNSVLTVLYAANSADELRRSVNGFYDMLIMASRALNSYGTF
ncbi:hypothetical protein RB653_002032 [Dictyostelium firmibasis]|uniref:Uncharacterized protein n=1 Tax=Dictyostelium firmibasis TaxID=79012 RepID=A0AAN7TPY8_9MYCE